MRRTLVLVTLVGLAASCFAPILDKPGDASFYPEQSQEKVAGEQAYQGTVAQVGEVSMDDRTKSSSSAGGDAQASKVLDVAGQAVNGGRVVAEQAERLDKKPGAAGGRWVWGGAFLVLGIGAVLGLRAYANKTVPPMPNTRQSRW